MNTNRSDDLVPAQARASAEVEAVAQGGDGTQDGAADRQPRFRGWLHLLAAVVSIAGLAWLVRSASTWQARFAAWIYGLAAVCLYATSSTYHVFTRSPRARRWMGSLDHSMIFVLIAGTFTPVCVLAINGRAGWVMLALVWLVAGAGVGMTMAAPDRLRRLRFTLYLVLGWAAVVAIPALVDQPSKLVMMLVAGVLYTIGAVLFALHRPRLHPAWFGYHEVWHALGVSAGALLFAVNLGLVRNG